MGSAESPQTKVSLYGLGEGLSNTCTEDNIYEKKYYRNPFIPISTLKRIRVV